MKKIPFTKMHGTGNDYIYIDCTRELYLEDSKIRDFCIRCSDRHFGIGADGVILIKPSEKADFFMDMYNADGSRGEMCGNGIRCVAAYVYNKGLTDKESVDIDTLSGVKRIDIIIENGVATGARVNMGAPILEAKDIPVSGKSGLVIEEPIKVGDCEYRFTAVSMGNPHIILFADDVEDLPLEKIGPLFENHEIFPNRTNTEFVKVIDRTHLRMRVWERGSGETMACGSGTCAAAVAAVLTDRVDRDVTVRLNGGDLHIYWREDTGEVLMEGPAVIVYEGII